MPWSDWQFWVVSGLVLAAVVWMIRPRVLRRRRRTKATRVRLTIEGRD